MPTNLYGSNDNFDLKSSHVLPALLRKFHEAKKDVKDSVEIWGTGKARREFIHVDDCADALIYILKNYDDYGPINIESRRDYSIKAAAEIIKDMTAYTGEIVHDLSKPDGTPGKLMDSNRLLKLGWKPTINFKTGLALTYKWYLTHLQEA